MVIPEIPLPPPSIIDAADGGRLVLFVGAGLSRLAGSPGWEEFADLLLVRLVAKGLINNSVRMQLLTLPIKQRLSIAKQIAEKSKLRPSADDFRKMLMTSDSAKKDVGDDLYRNLSSISNRFVTTNYDEWLEYDFASGGVGLAPSPVAPIINKRKLVCIPGDFKISHLEDGKVVHLHGSLTDPESMIVTTGDYISHYKNDRATGENPVTAFLYHLFQLGGWSVLFIG